MAVRSWHRADEPTEVTFHSERETDSGFTGCVYLNGGCRYYAGPAKYHADDNACTPLLPFDNARVLRTVSKRP